MVLIILTVPFQLRWRRRPKFGYHPDAVLPEFLFAVHGPWKQMQLYSKSSTSRSVSLWEYIGFGNYRKTKKIVPYPSA